MRITILSKTLPNWHNTATEVELRIVSSVSFVSSDGTLIQSAPFYQSVICEPDPGAATLTIPEFTIWSTPDAIDLPNIPQYTFTFICGPTTAEPVVNLNFGNRLAVGIPISPTTTTLDQIEVANTAVPTTQYDVDSVINQSIAAYYAGTPLPINDPIPSIAAKYSFYTQNTATTNITDFLNPFNQKVIWVFIGDSHTSIFGTFRAQNSFLQFGYGRDNQWHEVVAGSSGVTSINSNTNTAQLIEGNATTGVEVDSVSVPGTTTISNLAASITQAGIVDTGTQSFTGAKTFVKQTAITYGVGVNDTPLAVQSGDTSASRISNKATNALAQTIFQLTNDGLKTYIRALIGSGVPGSRYTGGPPNANLAFQSTTAPNISFEASDSSGKFWWSTNSVLRATLNASAYQLKVPLQLDGLTSGSTTLKAQDVAGTKTVLLPNTTPSVGDNVYVSNVAGTIETWDYQSGSGGSQYEGRYLFDVIRGYNGSGSPTTTTGSGSSAVNPTLLTVASAIDFAIGQGIFIAGAGAAGKNLVTSISNIAGLVITLASPILTTVTTVKVQHDDSAAINAALTAAGVLGGNVFLRNGYYRCAGALVTANNSILAIPVCLIGAQAVAITISGEGNPGFGTSVLGVNGTIIDSQDFDGTISNKAAIISAKAYASTVGVASGTFNYNHVHLRDLVLRNKPNPELCGAMFNNANQFRMTNVMIDNGEPLWFTSAAGPSVSTQPTHNTNYGFIGPGLNNEYGGIYHDVAVLGYYNGALFGEHTCYRKYQAYACMVAWLNDGATGEITGDFLMSLCVQYFKFTDFYLIGHSRVHTNGLVEMSTTGPGWYISPAGGLIDDTSNLLEGQIAVHLSGSQPSPINLGCQKLDFYNMTTQARTFSSSAPLWTMTATSTTTPAGSGWVHRNDLGDQGYFQVLPSAYGDATLQRHLAIFAARDLTLVAGLSGSAIALRAGGTGSSAIVAKFQADGELVFIKDLTATTNYSIAKFAPYLVFTGGGSGYLWRNNAMNAFVGALDDSSNMIVQSGGGFAFASGANALGTIDSKIGRSSAGVLEVNDGTNGNWRDMKLRNLLMQAGVVTLASFTVATLPAAATAGAGATAFVTDANATMTAGIGTTVAGGGANKVPVYSDGANWKIG